jgi:S-adenosylmethionine-diacylglycerol 3-amino-3-carboxypropyl transferase
VAEPKATTELWRAGALGKRSRGAPQVIFGQVREDAGVELRVLRSLGEGQDVFCIASGGCTAFSLLAARPRTLHAVDINPAQVFLVELKKAALERLNYDDFKRCLTDNARPFYAALRGRLSAEAAEFWDARQKLVGAGLNRCGVIERKLKRAMRLFRFFVHPRPRIRAALTQPSLAAQRQFYEERWDSWRWRAALKLGLSRPALGLVYGRQFVAALAPGFADSIRQGLAQTFMNFPAQDNGYLWQTFLGCYPPSERALPVYLRREGYEVVKDGADGMQLAAADAAEWLGLRPARSVNFFALSNILEVTSAGYAAELAAAVSHAARPGALVCLRWILPPPREIVALLGARWQYEESWSQELAARDHSLLCKVVRVYRV